MKAWLLLPVSLSLSLLGSTAHADQCAWIDDDTAQQARAILARSPAFIEYCEPCGDKAPGVPLLAKSVEVRVAGDDYKEVTIDGKGIDLAYVFVKTDAAHYRNLAALAGCAATGVSPSLAIAGETSNGVLITASDAPLPPPPPVIAIAAPPVTAVAPPPPAPQPQVFVYTMTTTREIAWLPLALAAAGGFITGSAFMIMLIGVRRRRAMRPRATDL